jgi:hypothetical protein
LIYIKPANEVTIYSLDAGRSKMTPIETALSRRRADMDGDSLTGKRRKEPA